ncbi:hypothetical protein UY3_00427 [Chelonia mydas]|uniref:Myb/SANT-like DNA-binding domain-containing protein n=1 Tax=Chelonia mydas TaxID=8469 RepID=M7CM47_CHEMY|nr:hypothetical protein UY3_00427 [Chelonia mydas]
MWSTLELLDLLGLWGEKAVQSQLLFSCRNFDAHKQVARGMDEKGHNRDTQLCHAKIKELRQAYQKAREANCRSGMALKTCRFYKELLTIVGGDPTSTAKSPHRYFGGMEAAASGVSPEDEVVDAEVKLEENVGQLPASSGKIIETFVTRCHLKSLDILDPSQLSWHSIANNCISLIA